MLIFVYSNSSSAFIIREYATAKQLFVTRSLSDIVVFLNIWSQNDQIMSPAAVVNMWRNQTVIVFVFMWTHIFSYQTLF